MGILEQIQQMKQQGVGERQIVQNLQEQGISPKQINDALNQAQVKTAVSGGQMNNEQNSPNNMQPSVMNQQTQDNQQYQDYSNQDQYQNYDQTYSPEEYSQDSYSDAPSPNQSYSQQSYYPQEYSSADTYGYGSGGYDYSQPTYSDTMIEIAEQAITQKTRKMQKQVSELNEFSTLTKTKLEDLNNRLKRIETTIDKLQLAILDKVGSYADDLQSIKKEMGMMQDSFGKVVNQSVEKHSKKK